MFGKQLDRLWSAFNAGREGLSVLARNHERVAAGKLVRVDVTTTSDTMDVMRMGMLGAGSCRGLSFSFSLCKSLFSFHRWLQQGRVTRQVRRGDTRFERSGQGGLSLECELRGKFLNSTAHDK